MSDVHNKIFNFALQEAYYHPTALQDATWLLKSGLTLIANNSSLERSMGVTRGLPVFKFIVDNKCYDTEKPQEFCDYIIQQGDVEHLEYLVAARGDVFWNNVDGHVFYFMTQTIVYDPFKNVRKLVYLLESGKVNVNAKHSFASFKGLGFVDVFMKIFRDYKSAFYIILKAFSRWKEFPITEDHLQEIANYYFQTGGISELEFLLDYGDFIPAIPKGVSLTKDIRQKIADKKKLLSKRKREGCDEQPSKKRV